MITNISRTDLLTEPLSAHAKLKEVGWEKWPEIRDQWRQLVNECPNPSFFLSAEWVEAWLTVFGRELKPKFVFIENKDGLIGACVLVFRKLHIGPISIKRMYINMAGENAADCTYIEYNDILCRPENAALVAATLSGYLNRRSWDQLILAGFQEGAGLNSLLNVFKCCANRIEVEPSYYVNIRDLRISGASFDSVLSKHTRDQIRRSIKRYKELGQITVSLATNKAVALEMLDELAELHQLTWRKRGKAGAFSSKKFFIFHKELIGRTFDNNNIQIIKVAVANQPIGILYSFCYHGRVYFYQSGYSYPSDNRLQPGMVTLYYAIRECMQMGYDEFDFLAGDSLYKKRLASHERTLSWITFERRTLATCFFHWSRRVANTIRRYPTNR